MTPHPPPDGTTFEFLDVGAHTLIRHARWLKPGARATILLLPGFSEFIEKYFEVVDDLLARNLSVFAIDWRSQGLSTRPLENRDKLHLESFEQYLADLHRFVEVVVRPQVAEPVVILAHSMGGHLALRYMHDHAQMIQGAVLSAPMADIRFPPGMKLGARIGARLALLTGREDRYIPGTEDYGPKRQRFGGNKLTSDPERFAASHAAIAANPELAVGGPTYGWLAAALRSIRIMNSPGFPEAIKTPACLVGAGADRVVSTPANQHLATRMPNAEPYVIDGAQHEILMERDQYRSQFWKYFDFFLDAHIKR